MTKDTQKVEDFNFADMPESSKVDTPPEEVEKPKKESTKKKIARLEKQIATSGGLTPEVIKEARELAESTTGLNIDKFMQKHRLINIDIEQMLHAPLNKDGSFV